MEDKLRTYFNEMCVYKDLKKNNFFSSISLPSYLRDWILSEYQDSDGNFDIDSVKDFICTYYPNKKEWLGIKERMITNGETVKLLTVIDADIDIKTCTYTFTLPVFDLKRKETVIDPYTWQKYSEYLTSGERWGIIELCYQPPDEKQQGKIKLISFQDFCPYDIDLEYFKDVRSRFELSEWIDVLLGAIDYNPHGYDHLSDGDRQLAKMTLLTRLLPFVEPRINLIELAPKGTGKSYMFGSLSRYGWLADGGTVSRAKLFYSMNNNKTGIVVSHDFVALDEVQSITSANYLELRQVLKGYMEKGSFSVGDHSVTANAGIILLGNVSKKNQDIYHNIFDELPEIFNESALIDRFHGLVQGWNIPRMIDDLKMVGWALNTQYFTDILHELREDPSYRYVVDQYCDVPSEADTRDVEAIKRLATAYLKLLFPNVRQKEDIDPDDFDRYCLRPSMDLRESIRIQLEMMDEEYKGKNIPDIRVIHD